MTELDLRIKKEFENLPDDFWDFKKSSTRDLTHGFHSYPATMVYPISKNILKIMQQYIKIDPFMGSGTVLVEGMLNNISQIFGTDLNPLAVLMSKVKTTKLSKWQLKYIEEEHINILNDIYVKANKSADNFDYFIQNELKLDITAKYGWGDSAEKYIENYFANNKKHFNYQTFPNLGFWFTPRVVILLQTIKNIIYNIDDLQVKNFLLIAFSETIRIVSNTRTSEFKLFRMKAEKVLTFKPDVFDEYIKILKRNIAKMREFISVCKSKSQVNINLDDTRELNSIPNDSIDIVITSPPYGDSRTTVAYGQFSRLSLQWLDLSATPSKEIINLDKNLLGGKPYTLKEQWSLLGSNTLVSTLEKIAQKDQSRADDVFSFYVDLDKCLYAISQKMRKNSYQFWVVGNRTVKMETLQTDKIIMEMATKYNINYMFSFKRNIINKVMPSLNSPTNEKGVLVKTMTNEIIIVLKKE